MGSMVVLRIGSIEAERVGKIGFKEAFQQLVCQYYHAECSQVYLVSVREGATQDILR